MIRHHGILNLKSRAWLTLGFFLFLSSLLQGQDQTIADSLELIYESGQHDPENRLEILYEIIINTPDPDKMLNYSAELLEAAQRLQSVTDIFGAYLQTGTAYRLKGNPSLALKNHFKALEVATENQLNKEKAKVNIAIADDFSEMKDHASAVNYYLQAIEFFREENDSLYLAYALLNLNDSYISEGELDSALMLNEELGQIYKATNNKQGIAYNLGNIGSIYAQKGQIDKAESNLREALQMLEELGDSYAISSYLLYMSDVYFEKGDSQAALDCANRSLDLAREMGLKNEIRDANLKLYELYEKTGKPLESIKYYKDYVAYRDTISNIAAVQEVKNLEVAQKQAEVDLLQKESEISELQVKRQKFIIYTSIALLAMVALLAFNDYRRYRYVRNAKRLIEIEKSRSDDLLLNILPRETARELKDHGKVKAKKIESATVMFTDFVEFTRLSEHEDAELMVRSIDEYFKKFDEISTRYNLEKIKTIGDSYMCAGGLHSIDYSQAREVVMAAKEMIQIVKEASNSADDLIHFDIRIGIHTGPVVAGIVGTKKWQFDIWGDTVNIASRMESKSEEGRINISETTKNNIEDEFPCEYRGEIEVKNRGKLKMYFIS